MKRNKKIKQEKNIKPGIIKYVNEDTNEIKKFVLILVGVALVALLMYFLTAKFLVRDRFQNEEKEIVEEIDYETVDAGTLFNRESEYYVLCYDKSSSTAKFYANLVEQGTMFYKIYTMDLSLDINKKYVSDEGNSSATNPSELKIKNPTLILIKDGKIGEYIEGEENIVKKLKKTN